jgi:hypothetical protein
MDGARWVLSALELKMIYSKGMNSTPRTSAGPTPGGVGVE